MKYISREEYEMYFEQQFRSALNLAIDYLDNATFQISILADHKPELNTTLDELYEILERIQAI